MLLLTNFTQIIIALVVALITGFIGERCYDSGVRGAGFWFTVAILSLLLAFASGILLYLAK